MTQTALTGLVTPPRLPQGTLRIVPLGGLGEIGRNMAVFEIDGKLLIVDCGVLFPEETQPGVDLILPDFSYIEDRMDDSWLWSSPTGTRTTSALFPTCFASATTSRWWVRS